MNGQSGNPETGSGSQTGSQTGAERPAKDPDPKPQFPSNETVRHYIIIPNKPDEGGAEIREG